MSNRFTELISYAWKDTKTYLTASSAQSGVLLITATDSVLSLLNMFSENLASILELDEKLNMHFNIYSDAPENER